MNYDLMTTLCGMFVAVSGIVVIDDQNVFEPRTQMIAKCINIAAIALGLYFTNKSSSASKSDAPRVSAEEGPNDPSKS